MEALFVIPVLVSDRVDPKIVPALAKAIERNSALSYHGLIKVALLKKYRDGVVTKESYIYISNLLEMPAPAATAPSPTKQQQKQQGGQGQSQGKGQGQSQGKGQGQSQGQGQGQSQGKVTTTGSKDLDQAIVKAVFQAATGHQKDQGELITHKTAQKTGGKEDIEYPHGISFYHTIGLEPTIILVPITMKAQMLGGGTYERIMSVGIKCIPYKMKSTSNMIDLLSDEAGQSVIKKWFLSKWRSVLTKIPLTVPWRISKGERGGKMSKMFGSGEKHYDETLDIIFSPNSEQMSSSSFLKGMMHPGNSSSWSTMTIFSSQDFDNEKGITDKISSYRDLVRSGWGDIVIVNESKESAYFCLQANKSCLDLPFSYLRGTMNLDNVLDVRDLKAYTRPPFSTKSIRGVF